MLMNSTSDVSLVRIHARTGLAVLPGTNRTSNATVFTGFALKVGDNSVSISLLLNKEVNDIDVFVNSDLLGRVRENLTTENSTKVENYSITGANTSVLVMDSDTGVAINVSAG
jgi:hypothetical protein